MKSVPPINIVPTKKKASERAQIDTYVITPERVSTWKRPSFQRPLSENAKVRALAQTLKEEGDGIIPSTIVLGILNGEVYLLDGQHRIYAFVLSGLEEGIVDVRIKEYDSTVDMAKDYWITNQKLVKEKPDDLLRAFEMEMEPLRLLRKKCPFLGFDNVRRNASSPILLMSRAMRCWYGGASEVPVSTTSSAADLAENFSVDDAAQLAEFLNICYVAWGRDVAYSRLWNGLNLTICSWAYRRIVLTRFSPKSIVMTKDQWKQANDAAYGDHGFRGLAGWAHF